jgi:hypothetical protein
MSRGLGATERAILAALAVETHPEHAVPDRAWGILGRDLTTTVYGMRADASREATRRAVHRLASKGLVEIMADRAGLRVRLVPTTDEERATYARAAEAQAARRGTDQ